MAKTLAEHRKAAYLSTRELAEKADVAPRTVWRIEAHPKDKKPLELHPSTMRKIAAALNVKPEEVAEFAPRSVNIP